MHMDAFRNYIWLDKKIHSTFFMGLPRTQTRISYSANNGDRGTNHLFPPKKTHNFLGNILFCFVRAIFHTLLYVCINPSYLVVTLFRNDSISFGFGSKSQMERIKKIIFSRECYLFAMILMLL